MSDVYTELLDAAISHLEAMQARGVQFLSVSKRTLVELAQPPKAGPAPRKLAAPSVPPPANLARSVPPKTAPEQQFALATSDTPNTSVATAELSVQAKAAAFA